MIDVHQDIMDFPIASLVNAMLRGQQVTNVIAMDNVFVSQTLSDSNAIKQKMNSTTFQLSEHAVAMNLEWKTIFVTRKLAIVIAWLMSWEKLAMNANLNISIFPIV